MSIRVVIKLVNLLNIVLHVLMHFILAHARTRQLYEIMDSACLVNLLLR